MGIVVALIAAAGISTVIINANHHVIARTAQTVTPTAAYPDNLAPQASQATGSGTAPTNPPPVISGSSLPPAASASQPASAAPAAATPPSAANRAPPAARHGEDSANADQAAASVAATDKLKSAPTGESAVVTASSRLAETNSTATAFGNGRLAAGPAGTSAQVPGQEQARASGADAANADRKITTAVKSQIAADSTTQRSALAVTTINGIVILTGTVPTPDVVEHVKEVVQQVQDVRGVDATAVKVSTI